MEHVILKYKNFFAVNSSLNKYFYCEFGDTINIIHGANTSGKSTLIQCILYTFGINDVAKYLNEIYDKDNIFRLECTITDKNITSPLIIIRCSGQIYIKVGSKPVFSFWGINGDGSSEHIKLKEYYHQLFSFNLSLLSANASYTSAPIETIFLPYYIAQSTGWVSIRKSFGNLDFYKNFKEDYLDYYLGIVNNQDISELLRLKNELKECETQKNILNNLITSDSDVLTTLLEDETLTDKATEYYEIYRAKESEFIKIEQELLKKVNKFSFLRVRKAFLHKIRNNQISQNPIEDKECPICKQSLPTNLSAAYKYHQEINDTNNELDDIDGKINKLASEIDSLEKKSKEITNDIKEQYAIIQKHKSKNLTFEKWLTNKVNTQMINDINKKKALINEDIDRVNSDLKKYKTDEQIKIDRRSIEGDFRKQFQRYCNILGVKAMAEDRYLNLYRISFFPYQGVELHKTMLAYYFAFNAIISSNKAIHRFPFMLDAIFKEDIDSNNKKEIIDFISNNAPNDTQTIFSVAETPDNTNLNAFNINKLYFKNKARLIKISDSKRSFWREWDDKYQTLLDSTIDMMNN